MIKLSTNQMAAMSTNEGGGVEISLGLDDLRPAAERLQRRIARDLQILMGQDYATASAINKALKDDFLAIRLKCRAILIRLRDKVRDILLSAVPYKRRISRAKRGWLLILHVIWTCISQSI